MPRRPSDSALFVKFNRRPVLNEHKSWGHVWLDNENKVAETIEGANRPIHDNVDFVHIEIPGDRENVIDRPAMCCDKKVLSGELPLTPNCRARKGFDDKPMLEECDVHRFYDEYSAYKAGQADQQTGTDLKGWPGIDPASCEELAFYKVYTVEQLSEMNDSNVGRYLALRTRARDYLENAKKDAAGANASAQKEALDKALSEEREARKKLEAQVQELIAAQAKLSAKSGMKAKDA